MPPLTQFFISNHHLPGHLALLPWLGLIGLPLFTSSGSKDYWDSGTFALRCLAFLSTEILLLIVLVFAIAIPFVPYYAVLQEVRQSEVEIAVRVLFWAAVMVIVVAVVWRILQARRSVQS